MDVFDNVTRQIYSLPVALIFQNVSGSDLDYNSGFNRTPINVSNKLSYNYRRAEFLMNEPQKLENLGETLRKELKWAFILHTYGFGCLFFILAFYTFFSILNIRAFISSRPFMSTINGFLCLLGTSRAASLFIDPYNLKENMPKLIGQVLWDLGFPSIISAFCLVQLAFLQLTQLKIGPESLRRKSCLSLIVTAHFLLTIGMDIIVASHEHLMIVKHVIQYIFLTWGVFLCSTFLYSGYKVMSMIRSIPGGFKHRDLPDPSYKGIMQLAILAPHNNLAGSMTAALLPTLCTPKIHQKDNVNFSSVGFRNEGNSRILESESIPMLEEMTGSSGDETNTKQFARGSSFQNQTRNSQKFNLKPKLSLRSVSDNEDEGNQEKNSKQKSPKSPTVKNQSPKRLNLKSIEFDFNTKPGNGILKHTENFVTTKSILEFKSKIQNRTSFENENFHFPNEKKFPVNNSNSADNLIPDILISCPSGSEPILEDKQQEMVNKEQNKLEKNQDNLSKIMKEITKDLKEMQIVREDKSLKNDEIVEVHKSKTEKSHLVMVNKRETNDLNGIDENQIESMEQRRGSQISKDESRRNSSRKESITLDDTSNTKPERSTSEITNEMPIFPQKINRRKTKSLSWKKKEVNEEENATQECLLPQENQSDVSLRAVLNHIAYMNRIPPAVSNEEELEKVKKSKVEWVLNITYITAMWGLMLCLSNMGRIYSPFVFLNLFAMFLLSLRRELALKKANRVLGLRVFSLRFLYAYRCRLLRIRKPVCTKFVNGGLITTWEVPESRQVPLFNTTQGQERGNGDDSENTIFFSSWPWLWFQTFCRALELAMGCAMANITRQPTANHRYPRTLSLRHRDTLYSM